MFSLATASVSPTPLPPAPMIAMFSFSFAEIRRGRGVAQPGIMIAETATAEGVTKRRREMCARDAGLGMGVFVTRYDGLHKRNLSALDECQTSALDATVPMDKLQCALAAVVCVCAMGAAAAPFTFQHHYIDRDLPGDSYGQTCLVDVDKDGDLDFVTGGRDKQKTIYWFEFQTAGKWVRRALGTNHPSDVGGMAFDVDADGWIDHVTGGVWYRNTGKPRAEMFERIVFDAELSAVHDLVAVDIDRDGRTDVVTMSDRNNLRWYKIPTNPREPWKRHDVGGGVHAGVAVGDVDGDGDLDVAR